MKAKTIKPFTDKTLLDSPSSVRYVGDEFECDDRRFSVLYGLGLVERSGDEEQEEEVEPTFPPVAEEQVPEPSDVPDDEEPLSAEEGQSPASAPVDSYAGWKMDAKFLMTLKMSDLRAYAEDHGLNVKSMKTKGEVVNAILSL